jgi:uncharacterized protein
MISAVDHMTTSTTSLGLIIIFLALTGAAQTQKASSVDDPLLANEIKKWRADRLTEINGEAGWNTLVGLFWLHEGRNRFGSDPSNDIVLPRGRAPKRAGSLLLRDDVVRLEATPEAGITRDGQVASNLVLESDADGAKPTTLKLGSLTFFVIKRGERFGLRVKDKMHPARLRFTGLDYYPVDPKWRINARFESYPAPKTIPIVNVLGMVDNMASPGVLGFELDGKTYRLEPVLERGSKELFIIFSDITSGKETYGAGRYLYADRPGTDGIVVLDFNKAHNPPCAFTKFATCPLPPRANRLAVRIEAGEKKYASAH